MNIDRTVSAASPEGIVLVSEQGIIERLNAQAMREILLSISQNQAVSQSIIDILNGQVTEAVLKDLIGKFRHAPADGANRRSVGPTSQFSVRCDALQDAQDMRLGLLRSAERILLPCWRHFPPHGWPKYG